MADEESRDDDWGDKVARITFRWTIILAAVFVTVVVVLILR